ncbi:MAG: zinc metallopeptidase, partial [Candidatus Eremiobacteraeota bacterium]|nr:zinc metallopeptidase [Candidatus Eremiobacteraeota bacterium]
MWFFSPLYIIIIAPALILSIYASIKVQGTFKKYSKVPSRSGLTGAQVAREILNANGLNVPVEETRGMLGDHYDPRS